MLALLEAGLYSEALPIVKWLVNQRNELGGFQSTQDTFIGLQALAKFAESASNSFNNVQIGFKYNEGAEGRISVNGNNALIQQVYDVSTKILRTQVDFLMKILFVFCAQLPNNVRQVNVTASGRGLALLQLTYKYNLNVTGAWPRFTLDPQPNKNSHQDYLHLTVCTR